MEEYYKKWHYDQQKFWTMIKPFLTIKGMYTSNQIWHIQGNYIISDKIKFAETLNNAYINVAENHTGMRPVSIFYLFNVTLSPAIVTNEKYKCYPSILYKETIWKNNLFFLSWRNTGKILKLTKRINISKATGEDQTLSKLVKIASEFLLEPMTDISNPVSIQILSLTKQKEPQ